jgi:hypothetical protein
MRRVIVVAAAVLAVLGAPRPADAWSFEVHRFIMARAIPLLPEGIRPFFEKFQAAIVEHSIDPDLWRTAGWEDEPVRHFLDMDAYGPFPFKDLPRDYEAAVKLRGEAFVVKNGLLPWRGREIHAKLVEAFTQKGPYSRENIKFFASVLAHYGADGHVPFHAAVNYDGQLTGQRGIHSRFESELFERFKDTLTIAPKPIVPVPNARDFFFDTLMESFPHVQVILDADTAAVEGREFYDDEYFTLFFSRVKPILERRLSDSITGVASLITAAWVEAGRPALPLDAPRTPRPVRRQ